MDNLKGRQTINKLVLTSITEDEYDYENDIYKVWYIPKYHQLTISRKDDNPVESWYDMWNIKNQTLGEDTVAIEIYPRRKELIDGENQRHLFVLDTKEKISFENTYKIINRIEIA